LKMEQELQTKYMQMQMLEQQSKQMQEQIQQIDQQSMELEAVKQSLDELKGVKTGTEILVPISGGLFIKAEMKDSQNVLVNVGAGTTVQKDVGSAKKLIDEQLVEMETVKGQIMENLDKLGEQFGMVQEEMRKLMENQEKK